MPRLTQERRSARQQQIVDAARQCFLRQGFHATSMADVLGAAQLSAGAVYNYFASKEDLIAAISQQALEEVELTFAHLRRGKLPALDEAITAVFSHQAPMDSQRESAQLLVQVWAEALRSPTLNAKVVPIFRGVREVFADLVATYQEQGAINSATPPEAIADVLLSTLHGIVLRRALFDDFDLEISRQGLRALFVATATEA
jgi:AcrR family transcriptional regulator